MCRPRFEMKDTEKGVCAPIGFKAAGVHCGIRKNKSKLDLALIVSDRDAAAAGVYTRNKVKGAPIAVTKEHIADGKARAIVCNSGNANTCNADGEEKAREMCRLVELNTGIPQEDVIVASTGVIGQILPIEPIAEGMPALAGALSEDGSADAAAAIMTTDTVKKEFACEFELGGKTCRIGAVAKGSGMIHPNMATLLCFVTTDAAVSSRVLARALREVVDDTLNMVSIDGDSSTNDMALVLANGAAGNKTVDSADGEDYAAFRNALLYIMTKLSKAIAKDGEGATRLIECAVSGAADIASAKAIAKSVVCSSLLKAAMFASDANWGRILCAIGYADAVCDIEKVGVVLRSRAGSVEVCKDGNGVEFSEEEAKKVLLEDEVTIDVTCGDGTAQAVAWGCDLTYDYVKINADYRT